MPVPGCHDAPASGWRVFMTAALALHVDRLELPVEPGVSPRAVRAVLRMMTKIANDAGEFRYGLRGSKLAALTDYSLSVIRRAQRYLVDHGYLERLEIGGGRASTRWRVLVDKLRPPVPQVASGHSSSSPVTQQHTRPDTAQERRPMFSHRTFKRVPQAGPTPSPPPIHAVRHVQTCVHGGDATLLPSGLPRCPSCRRGRQTG